MLRFIVLALLLANGAWFAWSHGFLHGVGLAPVEQREPERQANQIAPENIRLLKPEELAKFEAQAEVVPESCLQAGPLGTSQGEALRKALVATLPGDSWELQALKLPERWIVYMGTYDSVEQLRRKRSEVAARNLPMEPLRNPALEPGISLGGFASQGQARELLAQLAKQGIHSARVVQEQEAAPGYMLKLPVVTESINAKLPDLKAALADAALHPCAAATTNP